MTGRGLRITLIAAVVVLACLPFGRASAIVTEGSCASTVTGDFDESGHDDIAIGVPNQDVDGAANAGAVHVMYGTATGLQTTDDQVLTQDSPGVGDQAEAGDRFGACLAVGDFNADGQADLAIGAPGENLGSQHDAGAINVIYGTPIGLDAIGPPTDDFIHQNSRNIGGTSEDGDGFGSALGVGDFDGDGRDDVAIGVPFDDVVDLVDAGAVNVLYGASGGLTARRSQFLHQDRSGIAETAERRDEFGASLASGDFDGDGEDDLAVGVPGEKIGARRNAGAVHVIYARDERLSKVDRTWTQDDAGVDEDAEESDRFGTTLAAADFDDTGFEDLAIGIPFEDIAGNGNAGRVAILFGSASGVNATTTPDKGVDGAAINDQLGASLAAGNFDADPAVELAAGQPNAAAGFGQFLEIHVDVLAIVTWQQGAIGDVAEVGDQFGYSLVTGDFDGLLGDDVAAGAPGEDTLTIANAGGVNVVYGDGAAGLNAAGAQFFDQDAIGANPALDGSESGDRYGASLG